MRRKTYDSTLRRIDIDNIETIGTYTRTFSRSTRMSPGRCPNHPSHPRIVISPTRTKIKPTVTTSWPSGLLPTMNSYRTSRSPLLRPGTRLLNRYCALLGGYRAPGQLEPPDEQRVEDERDRNPQLSLLELEYPAHHVEDQGVDRQPERWSEKRSLPDDDADADDGEHEADDLLDPPQTRLGTESESVDGNHQDVNPAADGECDDRQRDHGPQSIARKKGRRRLLGGPRDRISHGPN